MLLGIEITDFRCYDHLRLDFDGQPGLTAVTGRNVASDYSDSNGTGKSSLWMAHVWCAFGKFPGMSSPNSVIRDNGGRGTKATVKQWIRLKDGRKLFMQRTRQKGKTKVILGFDDEKAQGWDEKEANAKIEEILGLSYDRYCQLMLFTGAFVFAEETDKGQKAILDSLVQLDLGSILENVKETWSRCDAEVNRLIQGNAALERRLAEIDADFTAQQTAQATWMRSREENAARDRQLLQEKQRAKEEAASRAASWAEWRDRLREASNDRLALQRAVEQATWVGQQVSDLDRTIAEVEQQLVVLQSDEFHCPSCNRPLDGDALAAAQANARGLRTQAEARQKKLVGQRRSLAAKLQEAQQAEATTRARVDQVAATEITLEQAELGFSGAQQEVSRYQTEIATLTDRLTRLEAEASPYAEQLAVLEARYRSARDELAAGQESEEQWRTSLKVYAYLLQMFDRKGLPHFALEMTLPGLTHRASVYLSKLSPTQMRVAFQARNDRGTEKFHVIAASESGAAMYSDLSAGERQRINLAIFLALHDIACETLHSPGVVWIDEVLDVHTDESGKLAMLELLNDYATQRGLSVWIITNDHIVSNERRYLRNVVTLEKTNEGVVAR